MATPLIKVIEECEGDIARFMADLDEIIKEADADGVRDEDEKKEIKNFEDSIKELEKFTKEKRAEFEKNKSEWDGMASKVSGLQTDYQTLADWGEPDLNLIDGPIGDMHANEEKMYYRDAINCFLDARELIDPMVTEYDLQSDAKVDYDKEIATARQRIAEAKLSEAADSTIIDQLNLLNADLDAAEKLGQDLNYKGALDSVRVTATNVEGVEKSIEANAKTIELVQGAYTDLVTKYNKARETAAPYKELVEELTKDFQDGAKTFGELIEAKEVEKAKALIHQLDIGIDASLEQMSVFKAEAEAAQKKAEEEEALLRQERAELATELSASSPKGLLWKLYDWKNGDTFDKLAKDSKVKDANIIMDHPNNKKAADYYRKNNELPIGTLVCVLDPTVKIYKVEVEGEDVYLTESNLATFTADGTKLMSAIAAYLNGWFINLEKNNKLAYDARHMAGWISRYMTGWDLAEPTQEREAARKSVAAIQGKFSREQADQFTTLTRQAFKDCETYKAALIKWLAEMQHELKGTMENLDTADTVLKGVAVVGIVTVCAPASIPGAVLYNITTAAVTAGGAAAGISVLQDTTKVVTAWKIGAKVDITLGSMFENAVVAGLKTGVSAAIFGGIFAKLGPAIGSRLCSSNIVQSQAARLLSHPTWSQRIIDFVKLNPAASKLAEGGTLMIDDYLAQLTPIVVNGYLKLFGRISWGQFVGFRNELAEGVANLINSKPDVLSAPTEEAAAESIADQVLDTKTVNGIFDVIWDEQQVELEKILAEDIKKMHLELVE